MQISVAELAQLLKGEVEGDSTIQLNKVAKIEKGEPGALSFLSNAKYEQFIYETASSAVLVNRTFTPLKPLSVTLIRVDDAYASFSLLLEKFSGSNRTAKGVDATAFIDAGAQLGSNVTVGAMSYIAAGASLGDNCYLFPQVYIGERVVLGKNCVLYPGVKIYHETIIGDNCIIHAGTVIGSDGFGFAPLADRTYRKIPQTGNVIIEDDVEIGANTCIDRATMGSTIIRKGVKLDNLIQIAHNVEIGEHTVIAAQCGIAGSSKVGKYCMLGGQVGVVGHLTVPDGSNVGAQSGIINQIEGENGKWLGFPAIDYRKMLRAYTVMKNLPDIEKRLIALEKSAQNEVQK